jgi:hypothetical protein
VPVQAKKEEKLNTLSKEKLKEKLGQFKNDKAFAALMGDVQKKGFKKVEREDAQWGFEGEVTDKSGKTQAVLFCIYDYVKESSGNGPQQFCSMLWRKVGNRVYKAYLVFPAGETNMEKALSEASEWYADEKGIHKSITINTVIDAHIEKGTSGPSEGNAKEEIHFASNWGSCFLKCVQTGGTAPNIDSDIVGGKLKVGGKTYTISCPGFCMFSAVCAATALTVGVALSETGVGLAMAIIAAGVCGLPCSGCFGMCAIGCL